MVNHDPLQNFTLTVPVGYFHNPYFYEHLREDVNIALPGIFVQPGGISDWVDVGSLINTQQHGTWNLPCGAPRLMMRQPRST